MYIFLYLQFPGDSSRLPSRFFPFLKPNLPSLSSTLRRALRKVRPAFVPPLIPLALVRPRTPIPIGIIEACLMRWGGASLGGESESPYDVEELDPYGFLNHFTKANIEINNRIQTVLDILW